MVKTEEQIMIMKEGGKILALILKKLAKIIKPGTPLKSVNDLANELCEEQGVVPVFLNYKPDWSREPFPGSLCISINEEVVHGIPNNSDRRFEEGDVVALDMGLSYKGLIVDSAITIGVGAIDKKAKKLISVTEKALYAGIDAARVGKKTGDIGHAISKFVKKYGYGIPLELGGHGVGHRVHEDPFIPNFDMKGKGVALKPGMTIAIEPQLTEGKAKLYEASDGYTLKTADGKRSAHFEHTIAITQKGPLILTEC